MSKMRKRKNAATSTPMVRGSVKTDRIMPATSSMTTTPGSFVPSARSTRPPAQIPRRVAATKVAKRAGWLNGMSHSAISVTKLPTVPGTIGEHPAPPALAMAKASRSTKPGCLLSDQFVAVHLDDGNVCESSWPVRRIAQEYDAVDLGRLSGHASLERKRRIGSVTVDENGLTRPEEGLLARPGEPVLSLLDERGTFCHDLGRHLVGHRSRGRAFLHRIGEDAQSIEGDVLDEPE